MKLQRTLRNRKGFSLVELMVVVAIIGILAVIGIPQYQKFMAKARQAEAKTHLNAIYQGESSFFTEYNNYTISMRSIGAAGSGNQLRYTAGSSNLNACTVVAPTMPPEQQAAADDSNDYTDALVNAGPGGATWAYFAVGVENDAGAEAVPASTCTQNTFTLHAWGNPTNNNGVAPNNAANNRDVFSMSETRTLSHVRVGM